MKLIARERLVPRGSSVDLDDSPHSEEVWGMAAAKGKPSSYDQIWKTVRDIPRGTVATYGQIAELAGLPRRARLVGYALHNLPPRLKIPWHRVINAQGRISFPEGSESYERQLNKLAVEGIEFVNGRVDMRRHQWRPTLDELLWKPDFD